MQWWTQKVIILFCNLLYPTYFRTHTQLNKIGLSLFRYLRFLLLLGRYLCWWTINLQWYHPPSQ